MFDKNVQSAYRWDARIEHHALEGASHMGEDTNLPISPDLLEILRDPLAVQDKEKYGPDPGRLELAHNCWLVSKDTGYKYPIKDGIPVMLIEEGEKWKDTPVEKLPVPPPA
jgi:uncharacterized protein YbaR (Trm112 family)